jgi:hypothetical protein
MVACNYYEINSSSCPSGAGYESSLTPDICQDSWSRVTGFLWKPVRKENHGNR